MKNSFLFLLELLSRSKRRWVLSTIELVEEDQGPFPKVTTQLFNDRAKDDDGHIFRITGMGVTEEPLDTFSINKDTGVVSVHKPIDREKYAFFHISFDILHRATGNAVDKTLSFDVAIVDINDNPPRFEHTVMRASVSENTPEGLLPVRMVVNDLDQFNTINSTFTVTVLSQEPKEPKLHMERVPSSTEVQLGFKGCFDYEKVNKYKVIVEAKDHGIPALSSTAVINLNIQDSNTYAPTFKKRKYEGEVMEMETGKEILRVAVEDKDTPKTPGWRAKYFFVKGNEDKNYQITTDPETNEGILTVIKGKDYERTTLNDLQIGVENEEKLFVCKDGVGSTPEAPPLDVIGISLKVIDINDPPKFKKKQTKVFHKEEGDPGTTLFVPDVTDEDSDVANIRYKVVEDPAKWVTIDPVTGVVKTIKKMDRESQYVDSENIYTIVVAAIDDGQPPATATSTILIQLTDINDNHPGLVNGSTVMCVNKVDKVMVPAADKDLPPYSGPFSFALGGEDKALKETWKLDPANGEEMGLVALRSLAYGNYSVPLSIRDQQGGTSEKDVVLVVVVCDCGGGSTCRSKQPRTSGLGGAAIGLIIAGLLLLLLLLLLLFTCACGKEFMDDFSTHEEGNQTLIKYNQEGGGSSCKAEPTFLHTRTSSVTATDGRRVESAPKYHITSQEENFYQNSGTRQVISMGSQSRPQQIAAGHRDTLRSQGGQSVSSAWNSNWMTSVRNGSSRYQQTSHMFSEQIIEGYLEDKVYALGNLHADHPSSHPIEFTYEGEGSRAHSLDELSLDSADSLDFLNDLGPRFKTLGGLCDQKLKGEPVQL